MIRAILLCAVVAAATIPSAAEADDSWMGWQTVNDGQSNGIEVSFRPLTSATCGKPKPFVVIFPRFRNNYAERVTGNLEVVHTDLNGTTTDTIAFALDPSETAAMTSSPVCVDTSKPIKIAIVGLRFPARDAEAKKLADAKAAADKVAADKAAQQKAAADKLAAERAAAEAARKKQLESSHKESQDFTKNRDEKQARASEAERDENERKRVAALEEEQAARERMEATKQAQLADLRRGEFSFLLPTGYQRVEYASTPDNGLAVGVRGELRVFAWWAVRGERGSPQGNGFEFALSGGYQKLTDALEDGAATGATSLLTGFARVRFWRSPLAIGLAAEVNRYTYEANGMTENPSVVALGPEIAIGFAANRLIAVELGARAGAVGPGVGDMKFSFSDDLYLAAYGVVGMNYLYAGATATRYVVSSGGVPQMWSAIGVLGIRVPF